MRPASISSATALLEQPTRWERSNIREEGVGIPATQLSQKGIVYVTLKEPCQGVSITSGIPNKGIPAPESSRTSRLDHAQISIQNKTSHL